MKTMWSTAIVIVAVSAAVGAQSGKEMDKSMMGDKTPMMYTGCVESVNHDASFLLSHVADDSNAMTQQDGMMKSDSRMANKDQPRASNEMHDEHMMPAAVVLAGRSDLKKHVGQKVRVTGSLSPGMSGTMSNGRDTLTVASLKVLAKSCKL